MSGCPCHVVQNIENILEVMWLRRVELLNETPSQSYWVSLAIGDHTGLLATRHKWTHP